MNEKKIDFKSIGKNLFLSFLFTIVAIFIIIVISKGGNFLKAILGIKPLYLILSFSLVGLSWIFEALKVIYSAKILDINITYAQAINLTLIGNFFSGITPFQTGGQPFQMYLLSKNHNVEYGKSAFFLLVKDLMTFIARISLFLAIPVFVVIFRLKWNLPKSVNIALDIGLTFYAFVTVLLFLTFLKTRVFADFIERIVEKLFPPKLSKKVNDEIEKNIHLFEEGKKNLSKGKIKELVIVFFYSLLCWLTSLLLPVVLLRALGSESPALEIIFVAIVFFLSVAFTPTPGTSGAAELGIAVFFSAFLPRQPLVAFILLWRFFYYYLGIIIGGLIVFREFIFKKKKERKEK